MDVLVKHSLYCKFNMLHIYCRNMVGLKWEVIFPWLVCGDGFDTEFAYFSLMVCLWNLMGSSVSAILYGNLVKINLFIVYVIDVSVKHSSYCKLKQLISYFSKSLGFKWGVFFPWLVCGNGFYSEFADFSLNECLWKLIGSSCLESWVFVLCFITTSLLLVYRIIWESFQITSNWTDLFTIWSLYLISCWY